MSDRRSSRQAELDPLTANGGRRPCDWPDCQLGGDYRAPKSRERLREFHHFCLEHVRAYNLAWDFFSGMSQAEIEGYLREDVTWHRPTWPLGSQHQQRGRLALAGPLPPVPQWRRPERRARSIGMGPRPRPAGQAGAHAGRTRPAPGATRAELKARYKQLAKRHHPDLHGGDKRAEERLKLINEAYTYLLDSDHFA